MAVSGASDVAASAAARPPGRRRSLRLPEQTLVRNLLVALIAGVVLFLFSEFLSPYNELQMATAAYYFVAVAGLTLLTGLNGQISLGHGALMAVGAYATGLLVSDLQWPLGVALVAAAPITAVVGGILGLAAARLRGPYLAGATLAFAVALPTLADKYPDFLGGSNGLTINPPIVPASLGANFPLERWEDWIACAVALVVFVLLANLVRGRYGRLLRAVRDDEIAAQVVGLSVARLQVLAFVISAACAGLAGGLLVLVSQLAAPGAFPLILSLSLLTAAVLGGLGSMSGAVWGALALVLLPRWSTDVAQSLSLNTNAQGYVPYVVYGLLLIGLMIVAPGGIQGGVRALTARLGRRRGEPEQAAWPDGSGSDPTRPQYDTTQRREAT